MKIGFLDSGIGGISVLHQTMRELPEEDYIFYADVDHVPYGERTKEEIISYVDDALSFMKEHGAKVVVIACNTATSVAVEKMREKYDMPIIGMEPAVKPAVEQNEKDRVMVIATPVTVREHKLKSLLKRVDKHHQVDILALPNLVRFAERDEFNSKNVENYLKEELQAYDMSNYSAMVLGCTHFNYFKDTLRKILPQKIKFIDGCSGTIRRLKEVLEENNLKEHNTGSVEYYLSGRRVTDEKDLNHIEHLYDRLDDMLKL